MFQAAMFSTMKRGPSWLLQTGNFVYMTSNNAPSPFVATTSDTPSAGSAYMAFDNSDTNSVTFNYGSGIWWAKMMWTTPIRIQKIIARVHRSSQLNTLFRIYGIKADNSSVKIYEGTHTSDTNITVTSTDILTEFIGIRIEVDKRSDLICNIKNCRITEWYSKI